MAELLFKYEKLRANAFFCKIASKKHDNCSTTGNGKGDGL